MLAELFKRVQTSWRWVRALDLASKGKFEAALGYAMLVEADAKNMKHTGVNRYGVYAGLLRGFLLFSLSRFQEADRVLSDVQGRLRDLSNDANDEIRYLRCYAAVLLRHSVGQPTSDANVANIPDCEGIDITKVPVHVKKNFPLRVLSKPQPIVINSSQGLH
jgi:hypothetical protein